MKGKLSIRRMGLQGFSLFFPIATLLSLFPPSHPVFLWWEAQATLFMLLLLGLGMLCFFLNFRHMMIVSLACCGLICFTIHERTESSFRQLAWEKDEPDITAAHFRVPVDTHDRQFLLTRIKQLDPDLLSLQASSLEALSAMEQPLKQYGFLYSKHHPATADHDGLAVFSHHPFELALPTKAYQDQGITGRIELPDRLSYPQLQFATAVPGHPAFSNLSLEFLATYLQGLRVPTLALGDFSCVPWSLGLSHFKQVSAMKDSHRILDAASIGEYVGLSSKPTFHIFHSAHLQCTDFQLIRDEDQKMLGISGTYRLAAKADQHVSQTN